MFSTGALARIISVLLHKSLLKSALQLLKDIHRVRIVPAPAPAKTDAAPVAYLTEAEVGKVDKDNKKLTIKHGEVKNLDMPGMTMVFQVKDPAMVDQLKVGDKICFKVKKASSEFVVTEMQAVEKQASVPSALLTRWACRAEMHPDGLQTVWHIRWSKTTIDAPPARRCRQEQASQPASGIPGQSRTGGRGRPV